MKVNCGCRLITCEHCYPKDKIVTKEQRFFSATVDGVRRYGFTDEYDFNYSPDGIAFETVDKDLLADLRPLTLATANDVVIRKELIVNKLNNLRATKKVRTTSFDFSALNRILKALEDGRLTLKESRRTFAYPEGTTDLNVGIVGSGWDGFRIVIEKGDGE